MTFGQIKYVQDQGEGLHRRSLYTFWRRTVAPTTLFDVPSRQTCTVRQARTNSPLHALTLLNDVTYVEAARKLAERALLHGGEDDPARLAFAFRICTARRPRDEESEVLARALERLRTHYREDRAAAEKLIQAGEGAARPLAGPSRACGLDRRGQLAPEPRRDHHQGMTAWT